MTQYAKSVPVLTVSDERNAAQYRSWSTLCRDTASERLQEMVTAKVARHSSFAISPALQQQIVSYPL
ncbi:MULTISPECIES: hypothetical protein [Xanthomonas]|uniref:hypothetical protein n=1 Tax=Xanthomonas TaxID=338 RepID=UPI000AD8AB38|nr:hypothetical protein [Xanthomonas phaseoli]MBO9766830.1 hypothetical protein [Xanthomonas phaseoli pv. dieffenbachiae]MBO9777254.1 hypothetical protein [Xanthomonas phaseoli pv. dieffenbachiae]MBO9780496.1 hypothetical protein [Xanthomonas phaseoli pv. dieffenbachiae]MBO9790268.1 hypothetical protein [Xanthomonas phaseoli pv. dieffenbachiae]MBO9796675.1 hypothetical protein [Xanthomonas phaseoli pv. dieffenbachiae]